MHQPSIDEIVAKVGEPARQLVTNAIQWLDANEPSWNLETPINRWEYIEGLLERANFGDNNGQ